MSCGPLAPVFWQRQPRLPLPVARLMGALTHGALAAPGGCALLVWPMVLGAPALRAAHPQGIAAPRLLEQAAPMLASAGVRDPEAAWSDFRERFPEGAVEGACGWMPHADWAPLASLVSLRTGVMLVALLGQPEGPGHGLSSAVTLFNCALFHECHDALEPLWVQAEPPLKGALQGLIMLAGAFHHQQLHNPRGLASLCRDGLALLGDGGPVATPWGTVDASAAAASARERLAWLEQNHGDGDLAPLWALSRPTLELR